MANIACGKSIFKNKLLYLMKWKNICEKKIFHFKKNKNMIIYFLYLFSILEIFPNPQCCTLIMCY